MTKRTKHKAWLWHNLCLFNVGANHTALHFSFDLTAPENSSFQASASHGVPSSETPEKQNSQKFISNQSPLPTVQIDKTEKQNRF